MLPISRRISGLLHGDYSGLLHRAGSELGDTRKYLEGDDVRRIDWSATARTNETQVHDTIADHELEVWCVVDSSPSMSFGTGSITKAQLAADVVSALGYLVVHTGNRIGAVSTGVTQKVIMPRGGTEQLALVMAAVQSQNTTKLRGTQLASWPAVLSLGKVIDTCLNATTRRGLVVIVSDFLQDSDWANAISHAAQRHDVIAVVISDPREHAFNDVGVVEFYDAATGRTAVVDTSNPKWRDQFAENSAARRERIKATLGEVRADILSLRTDSDWVAELATFLRSRKRRLAMGYRR